MANEYGNYATLDPLAPVTQTGAVTLSQGNRKVVGPSSAFWGVPSTMTLPSSGKFYVEAKINGAGSGSKGGGLYVMTPGTELDVVHYTVSGTAQEAVWGWHFQNNRHLVENGADTSVAVANSDGDIAQMAIDLDNNKVYMGINNTWYSAVNTTTNAPDNSGTQTFSLDASGKQIAANGYNNSGSVEMNFGATAFAHTPPSGYLPLNTANLPTPAVVNYEDEYYVQAGISHSNGSTTAVTLPKTVSGGAMVRIKETDATTDWIMFDTVRGVNKSRDWNQAEAEDTSTFDDQNLTGTTFTMPSDLPSGTYLLECFYVGSYFQIQTVTGNAGARTITWPTEMDSYGFSAFFPRSGASSGIIHHKDIGAQQVLFADGAGAVADRANFSQAPNKTDFRTPASVGPDFNLNTIPYVCYGWANSGPYSFGSYNGNQSTDGAFVNLGGFPQVIVSKPPNTGDSYLAMYHPLLGYNPNGVRQYWEENYANSTSTSDGMLDFVSNGVKFRTAGTGNNSTNSGYGTYLYFAFGIQSLTDGGVNQGRAK